MTVRALETMTPDEIRFIARDAADAGEPMPEWPDPTAQHARTFEQHYIERRRELEEFEG